MEVHLRGHYVIFYSVEVPSSAHFLLYHLRMDLVWHLNLFCQLGMHSRAPYHIYVSRNRLYRWPLVRVLMEQGRLTFSFHLTLLLAEATGLQTLDPLAAFHML